jgi:hypothetical protein
MKASCSEGFQNNQERPERRGRASGPREGHRQGRQLITASSNPLLSTAAATRDGAAHPPANAELPDPASVRFHPGPLSPHFFGPARVHRLTCSLLSSVDHGVLQVPSGHPQAHECLPAHRLPLPRLPLGSGTCRCCPEPDAQARDTRRHAITRQGICVRGLCCYSLTVTLLLIY